MCPYVTLKKYGENTSQLYCTNCQKKPWIFRNDVVPQNSGPHDRNCEKTSAVAHLKYISLH